MAKRMVGYEKQKLVYIKWLDAHSTGGWHSADGISEFINSEDCVCENVGWLLHEDSRNITLCCRRITWTLAAPKPADDSYGMLQKIPKTWIVERRVL